jgi:chromatin licensing and DNA replication factor 1
MDGANLSQRMSAVDSDDELSFLPQSLLQSVKAKEQRTLEGKETGFADQVKMQKLIASFPSTFDVICLIYQSRQWSVMTKQELIHKIIASSPKIMDRSEVEDVLVLPHGSRYGTHCPVFLSMDGLYRAMESSARGF